MPEKKKRLRTLHVNRLKKYFDATVNYSNGTPYHCYSTESVNKADVNLDPRISGIKIEENLSPKQKEQLITLLNGFTNVFSDKPGRTNLTKIHIETGDAKPIRVKPYRIPEALQEKVKQEISYMLENDIIEPSQSPWSSSLITVPKKDGSIRCCLDFRALNKVVSYDTYPYKRCDDILDRIANAKYISKIDLTRGYWQIPLDDESKPKTSFSTMFGSYQFKVLPFGIVTGQSEFQRLTDNVLKGAEQYSDGEIDDIAIFRLHGKTILITFSMY